MYKRQLLLAGYSARDIERVRLLVTFCARIDTIKLIIDRPNIETVARMFYELVPDSTIPRGAKAPLDRMISKTYSNSSARLALSSMYNSFDDLRKLEVPFEDAVLHVYKTYARKNHHLFKAKVPAWAVVPFEHFFTVCHSLEGRHSNLIRCFHCESRNLLTPLQRKDLLKCVFCELAVAKTEALSANGS